MPVKMAAQRRGGAERERLRDSEKSRRVVMIGHVVANQMEKLVVALKRIVRMAVVARRINSLWRARGRCEALMQCGLVGGRKRQRKHDKNGHQTPYLAVCQCAYLNHHPVPWTCQRKLATTILPGRTGCFYAGLDQARKSHRYPQTVEAG